MPALLEPLLSIQALDLDADAARKQSEAHPARQAIPELDAKLAAVEASRAERAAERVALEAEEERLGRAVAEVAREIEAADVEHYSGKRKNRDDATAHKASQAALRQKQSDLEEEELVLLESIERVELELEAKDRERATLHAAREEQLAVLAKVEQELADLLRKFDGERDALAARIPAPVLEAYARVRAQPRSGGRGSAQLAEGRCSACQIKLPVHEYTKMIAEPEDAVIQCPQCRRVFVRGV